MSDQSCRIVLMLDENNIDYNAPENDWQSYDECITDLEDLPPAFWKAMLKKNLSVAIQHVSGRLMSHSFKRQQYTTRRYHQ